MLGVRHRCWQGDLAALVPAAWASVAGGVGQTCGIHTDGTVECWGWGGAGQNDPPSGSFSSVVVGRRHSCGLRPTGHAACWGAAEDPPGGAWSSLSIGQHQNCGITGSGALRCWPSFPLFSPPLATYPPAEACTASPFPDVPPTHRFCADIAWVATSGTMQGYADGSFQPLNATTRQAFIAILYRLAGEPDGPDPTCTSAPFTDVDPGHPFCGEIAWAAANGIAGGYADGSFRPVGELRRDASIAFLYRLAGVPDGADPVCGGAAFTDVTTEHAFCGQIEWAETIGLATGFYDDTFRPAPAIERQAVAAVLYRFHALGH